VIIMIGFDDRLKKVYNTYKNHNNPPVPIKKIKEYLELSGISLDEDEDV